ncbi:MAG: response regulator [Clostridia bacterium]
MKILIIEDEYSLADAIAEVLKKENFTTNIITDGEEGENEALTNVYDLILLDIMLPNKDGFKILNDLRKEKVDTPIIILTAKSEINDKLNGLENGADDYITKPFHIKELVARVKVVLKRKVNIENTDILEYDDLKLDIRTGKMSANGNEISINGKELDLLETLLLNKTQIVNREILANKIITGSKVIENLVVDDSTLVTTITPTFILKDKDSVEKFTTEIKEKGLSEYYTLNTNVEELESATKSIENVKTFATTFLLIMLAISAVVLFVINMINIRERKYEIGVFRTIGVSKFKLTLQFALEILIVSVVMLGIGAVCGSFLAKPVGNMLLENEIQSVQEETEQISNNFGKGGPMDMNFGGTVNVQTIDTINAVVDITVVAQLLGIGLALMLVSSLASMISIQRFSPLTILKERS